jgi:HD-GYP domain-containing protein (c-di-GMP phosphodiesterase class II)
MIENVPFLYRETECILNHHERFDGKGYPSGKKTTDVPLCARIISIAEAWDTMISPQPYRTTPLSLDAALSELKKNSGKQFDPELVEVFSTLITG